MKKEKKIQGVEGRSMCKRRGLSVDMDFFIDFFFNGVGQLHTTGKTVPEIRR